MRRIPLEKLSELPVLERVENVETGAPVPDEAAIIDDVKTPMRTDTTDNLLWSSSSPYSVTVRPETVPTSITVERPRLVSPGFVAELFVHCPSSVAQLEGITLGYREFVPALASLPVVIRCPGGARGHCGQFLSAWIRFTNRRVLLLLPGINAKRAPCLLPWEDRGSRIEVPLAAINGLRISGPNKSNNKALRHHERYRGEEQQKSTVAKEFSKEMKLRTALSAGKGQATFIEAAVEALGLQVSEEDSGLALSLDAVFGGGSYDISFTSPGHRPFFRSIVLLLLQPSKVLTENIFAEWNLLVSAANRPPDPAIEIHSHSFPGDPGWEIYDIEAEADRQGVVGEGKRFHFVFENVGFKLTESYPEIVVGPPGVTADALVEISKFRTRGRFPVLAWATPGSAAVFRCAQPRSAFTRSAADEEFLTKHLEGCFILDARPYLNALANKARGAGYEACGAGQPYWNCSLYFADVPNVHHVRDAFERVADAATNGIRKAPFVYEESGWSLTLESSIKLRRIISAAEGPWVEQLSKLLNAAQVCVQKLEDGQNVLVHCTDGWDRTLQITAVVMLAVDPFFRSARGFAILIEKEFCCAGHQFAKRSGRGNIGGDRTRSDSAPIFILFLHLVAWLVRSCPSTFEFSESFLMEIIDEYDSNECGTFCFDLPKQRGQGRDRMQSVWTGLLQFNRLRHNLRPELKAMLNVMDVEFPEWTGESKKLGDITGELERQGRSREADLWREEGTRRIDPICLLRYPAVASVCPMWTRYWIGLDR